MDTTVMTYLPLFVLLLILFITQRNEKAVLKQLLKKRKTGDTHMYELAQRFIDKECIVYTFNSQITGVIKQVNVGGLLMEKDGTQEAINFDFIVRIREYPKNKNGKKRAVVLD